MKKIILSAALALAFNAAHATAPVSNPFLLNVNFEVSKCVAHFGSSALCDFEASLGQNILVSLTECTTTELAETCVGDWSTLRARDGFDFYASVTVTKTTDLTVPPGGVSSENNPSSYKLTASVGPLLSSQPPTSMTVYVKEGGSLTDAFRLEAPPLYVEDLSYNATLLIQPKFLTEPE